MHSEIDFLHLFICISVTVFWLLCFSCCVSVTAFRSLYFSRCVSVLSEIDGSSMELFSSDVSFRRSRFGLNFPNLKGLMRREAPVMKRVRANESELALRAERDELV